MLDSILLLLLACSVSMLMWAVFGFAISQTLERLDIADVLWGLGFILVAGTAWWLGEGDGVRGALAGTLVAIWAVRLTIHLVLRRRGDPEDRRYVQLQNSWRGDKRKQAFIKVFLVQAALTLMVATPIIVVNSTSYTPLNPLDWVGVAVWLAGFGYEVISDWQLSQHLANSANRGVFMTNGLWRYSRHPNYFGEMVQWWGLFLICLSVPLGFVGLIGPLTITFLILKVSGVPLLEKSYEGRIGWEAYRSRTSMIIPGRPRSNNGG